MIEKRNNSWRIWFRGRYAILWVKDPDKDVYIPPYTTCYIWTERIWFLKTDAEIVNMYEGE